MKDPSSLPEKLFPPSLESSELSAEELFEQAMADVKPIESRAQVPRKNGVRKRKFKLSDTVSEEKKLLEDFVDGKTDFDWTFHPGYQKGGEQAGNARLLRKLQRGAFAVQDQVDLHGLTRREALSELEEFIKESHRKGHRCIRIIHGKGKNSRNNIPVLKRLLPGWLGTKRLAVYIIAYSSAAPKDGGLGATYVLLRRKKK